MKNWYCNNCKSWEDSWAEKQFWEPKETYRRDIRCWSCNKRELIYTDSQKSRYKELVKERTDIAGYVEEVERFSTWWSNNIATAVVYYNGYYRVFLLVYDRVYRTDRPAVFPESYDCSYWGDGSRGRKNHGNPSDAKSEASWLRNELEKGYGKYHDNPILLIHPYCDAYRSYYNYVSRPHVVRKEVGDSSADYIIPVTILNSRISIPSNLSSHFRPLDVIKVKEVHKFWGVRYYHFGIYLGDGEICHFLRKSNGVRKTDWNGFLEDQVGELYKYHPIIPFKHFDKTARQIAICIDKKFREDCYNLYNRNCEHFANMIGFGINYSEQIEDDKRLILAKEGAKKGVASGAIAGASIIAAPFTFGFSLSALPLAAAPIADGPPMLNNDKGSTIKLVNEINETNDKLGYSHSDHWQAKEIKERYLQEVPPKDYCRIM